MTSSTVQPSSDSSSSSEAALFTLESAAPLRICSYICFYYLSASLLFSCSYFNCSVSTCSSSGGASSSSGPNAGSALSGDYGLLGLLGVIRMSDADRNALALGSDLTTLGLNLNSSDQLYSTFASPWSESPTTREPQYQVSLILIDF